MRSSSAIDHAGQLHVLVLDGLERAIERGDHHVEAAERLALELGELVLEVGAGRLGHGPPSPTFPVT